MRSFTAGRLSRAQVLDIIENLMIGHLLLAADLGPVVVSQCPGEFPKSNGFANVRNSLVLSVLFNCP